MSAMGILETGLEMATTQVSAWQAVAGLGALAVAVWATKKVTRVALAPFRFIRDSAMAFVPKHTLPHMSGYGAAAMLAISGAGATGAGFANRASEPPEAVKKHHEVVLKSVENAPDLESRKAMLAESEQIVKTEQERQKAERYFNPVANTPLYLGGMCAMLVSLLLTIRIAQTDRMEIVKENGSRY